MKNVASTGLMHRTHVAIIAALAVIGLIVAWTACSTPTVRETVVVESRDDTAAVTVDPREISKRVGMGIALGPERPAARPDDGPELHTVTIDARFPGGRPVERMEILVHAAEDYFNRIGVLLASDSTNAEGTAQFELPAGVYDVRAMHASIRATGIRIKVARDASWTMDCGPGVPLRIRVIDEDDAPIVGATVWERDCGIVATTREDGWAKLGAVHAVDPYVNVTAAGHLLERNYVPGPSDDTGLSATFRLARGGAVLVKVREEDGSFVPFADISVYDIETRSMRYSTLTNDVGEVVIDGVARPEGFKLRAQARDGRRVDVEWTPVGEPQLVLVAVLPPGRTLSGTVVNGWTGDPVPDASIRGVRDYHWEEIARSDGEGRFTMPRVAGEPGADVELMAYADGFAPDTEGWGADVTPESDSVRLVVFPTMTLAGRAVDSSGAPVADAEVWVAHPHDNPPVAPHELRARTDGDGEYEIAGVPPMEDLVVLVKHDEHGIAWTSDEIEPTADARIVVPDVVLRGRCRIDLRVVDTTGVPVNEARVWVRWRVRTQGQGATYRDVVDGVMDPIDIPRPSAALEIEGPGFVSDVMRVNAETREVVVSPPCRATGRALVAATGEPVREGLWVFVESKDRLHTLEGNNGKARTDADGRFSVEGLRPGRYRLRVDDRDGWKWRTEVDVTSTHTELGDLLTE